MIALEKLQIRQILALNGAQYSKKIPRKPCRFRGILFDPLLAGESA